MRLPMLIIESISVSACPLGYSPQGSEQAGHDDIRAAPWRGLCSTELRPPQQATPARQLYESAVSETDLSVPVKPSMGAALVDTLATTS